MAERVLPHSLEAERAVLGALLLSEAAWPKAASAVRASDFFRLAHQLIFAAMRGLADDGVVIDFVTLCDELRKRGQLDEAGGGIYIQGLVDGVPRTTNVDYYAAIVREKARQRALVSAAAELVDAAYAETDSVSQLVDTFSKRLLGLVGSARAALMDVADAVKAYVSALQSGTMKQPVPTGYKDVDRLIDGVRPSDLIIVAARPSAGKTSFALGIATDIARREAAAGGKRVVLFFSLEMGADGLSERLVSWTAGVSVASAVRGEATMQQYAGIVDAMTGYDIPLKFETSSVTLVELDAWCRRVEHEHGLAAVVVDYIQLMVPDQRQSSQEAEVAALSRGLKRLAKDLGVPVVALSQLSRAPEGRSDKRPQTSDLRGSGALEQDADMVVLIHRPEMYQRTPENEGVAEVIMAKNRQGPTGVVRLYFQKDIARFRDVQIGDRVNEEDE